MPDWAFQWLRSLGNDEWPVAPELLLPGLGVGDCSYERDGNAIRYMPGLCRAARRARVAHRGAQLVKDKGDIKPNHRLLYAVTCRQAHPGVCATRDAALYDTICSLATRIEASFLQKDEALQSSEK